MILELYVSLSSLAVSLAHFLIVSVLRLFYVSYAIFPCLEYLDTDESDESNEE